MLPKGIFSHSLDCPWTILFASDTCSFINLWTESYIVVRTCGPIHLLVFDFMSNKYVFKPNKTIILFIYYVNLSMPYA